MDLLTTYTHDSGTTNNYSAIANLHNSQITTSPTDPFPACCVFTSRSLATALTVEILHLHALRSSLHSLPYGTLYQLTLSLACNISARTTQQTLSYCYVRVRCCWNVFTEPLSRNGRGADHQKHRSSNVTCVYVSVVT
jgi:hypothetical protein